MPAPALQQVVLRSGSLLPQTLNWINRSTAAGAAPSAFEVAAFNRLLLDLRSGGMLDLPMQLLLLAGNGGFGGCIIPGIRLGAETLTNTNFASVDYTRDGATLGLTGNKSNKRIGLGITCNDLVAHGITYTSASWTIAVLTDSTGAGESNGAASVFGHETRLFGESVPGIRGYANSGTGGPVSANASGARLSTWSATASNALEAYSNGVSIATQSASRNAFSGTGEITLFAYAAIFAPVGSRYAASIITRGLTAEQVTIQQRALARWISTISGGNVNISV